MWIDPEISENGSGGTLTLLGNDLATVDGVENMMYLAMFGGSEWWANDLLLDSEDSTMLYKCRTEKTMREVALNSSGRLKIQQAAEYDLAFLAEKIPGTVVKVVVTIVSDDVVRIDVDIDGRTFNYLFNPRKDYGSVSGTGGRVHGDEFGGEYE